VLTGSLFLLSLTEWYIWAPWVLFISIVWSSRYKRALRQLSKPGFWLFFVVITLLTAFVFTDTGDGESLLVKGLLTGIQMNFRAVVMILGFSVIGTELYNPEVRNFFMRTSIRSLPLAVELSVESLPDFIASIPDFRTLVKDPVSIFRSVLSHAEYRLDELKRRGDFIQSVFIITGSVGEGKTAFVKNLINEFGQNGIEADGIITERIIENDITTGYDLVEISGGKRTRFLRQEGDCGPDRIGRFTICSEGLNAGNEKFRHVSEKQGVVIIIDEVGLLELEGKGWADFVTAILNNKKNHLLITVRTSYLDVVINKWNPKNCLVRNVNEGKLSDVTAEIIKTIKTGIQSNVR